MKSKKLSIQEFKMLKNELRQCVDNEEYFKLQTHLLSFDLSDIPFEEWFNLFIISDETHVADFSQTRANLDFKILNRFQGTYGNEIYKGCNLRNLACLEEKLNPDCLDEVTIKKYPLLFLSENFSKTLKRKFYKRILTVEDLADLNLAQMSELKEKNVIDHFNSEDHLMCTNFTIDFAVKLYNSDMEVYDAVKKSLYYPRCSIFIDPTFEKNEKAFIKKVKNANINDILTICFDYLKDIIIKTENLQIMLEKLPRGFIEKNADFLLLESSVPEGLRERYYEKSLTLRDVYENMSLFNSIPIDLFVDNQLYLSQLVWLLGFGNLQKLLPKYYKCIDYFSCNTMLFGYLLPSKNIDPEVNLIQAVKNYFVANEMEDCLSVSVRREFPRSREKILCTVPEWLEEMQFNFIDRIETLDQLLSCNNRTIVIEQNHHSVISMFGSENIKELEKRISFFSYKTSEFSHEIRNFYMLSDFFSKPAYRMSKEFDFKNGTLNYEEFEIEFAKCLNAMKKHHVFCKGLNSYDWINGEFREKYDYIFIDKNVPDDLRNAFYLYRLDARYIFNNPWCIKYLKDKNLSECLNIDIKCIDQDDDGYVSFMDLYTNKFGNEAFLELMVKYGELCIGLRIEREIKDHDKKTVDKYFRDAIAKRVRDSFLPYDYLRNIPEYSLEHEEDFIDLSRLSTIMKKDKIYLTNAFYSRNLNFSDIKYRPQFGKYLKKKNIFIAFGRKRDIQYIKAAQEQRGGCFNRYTDVYDDLELAEIYGSDKFIDLCSTYGDYLEGICIALHKILTVKNNQFWREDTVVTFEEIVPIIENMIAKECLNGEREYSEFGVPEYLKEQYPELFLDANAPEELKKYFYLRRGSSLSFHILNEHRDWVPYLKDKAVQIALLRNPYTANTDVKKYFDYFGSRALHLGISKPETVTDMITHHKVDLMKEWYDLTGKKFIPDVSVMENFPISKSSKFFASTRNWGKLMQLENFASTLETRTAMLKLAYTFGVFDNDKIGFNKLYSLLTDIPRHMSKHSAPLVESIKGFKERLSDPDKKIGCIENGGFEYMLLSDALEKEGIKYNKDEEIFGQIYRKNDDDSFTLTINPQACPLTAKLIRMILDMQPNSPIMTPHRLHQLFGRLEMRYDKDFREFLLANLDILMNYPEYIKLIASIQIQFPEIKAFNANRVLTLDLAASYVQQNRYVNVNPGNDNVAVVSAIAGYDQESFNELQKIYNIGKQRVSSSIPRIENKSGSYSYEILRLDDPLALAIGTLTDCCQELGNVAESCMEHSMIDQNGRIFVIRDDEKNIVAQSWVWRNKNVLCFDNIEIPDKAFQRANKKNLEIGRAEFSRCIYLLYKLAAQELIKKDEQEFRKLLDSGKITSNQFQKYKLSKVTVGLGYNDIAEELKRNLQKDTGHITRPLPFSQTTHTSSVLYDDDSKVQYILEQSQKNEDESEIMNLFMAQTTSEATLAIHSDEYIIYDDNNFTESALKTLNKLEQLTIEDTYNLKTVIYNEDKTNFVSEIAENFSFDSQRTKIIMNANFAIIYEEGESVIKLGGIFFNLYIDNGTQQIDIEDKVLMQIRLAFDQILHGKSIDDSELDDKQRQVYRRAINISDVDRAKGFVLIKK